MYTAFINYIVMIIMITILYHASAENSICNALMWTYGRTVAYISSFFSRKKIFWHRRASILIEKVITIGKNKR